MDVLTLLVNLTTLVITVIATMRRPVPSNTLIGGLAVSACLFSLHHMLTDRNNALSLSFTTLVVVLVIWRFVTERSRKRSPLIAACRSLRMHAQRFRKRRYRSDPRVEVKAHEMFH